MNRELPDEIDCAKGAGRTKEWNGYLNLQKFQKRCDFYRIETDPVLKVIIDSQRDRLNIEMTLYVVVEVECQRCLRPFSIDVNKVEKYVGIEIGAEQEHATKNDVEREAVILLEGKLSLVSLVEEEIFLEIPMIPKHPNDSDCKLIEEASISEKAKTKRKPFANLAEMIKENNN
jgi:uncharacterized metal-binding protein YceD (DUF177 family)